MKIDKFLNNGMTKKLKIGVEKLLQNIEIFRQIIEAL